jgi:hypothetical protein
MGTVKSMPKSAELPEGKTMWEALTELMNLFHVRRCVVDALPETDACKRWADKHPGKVYRAFYPSTLHAMGGDMYKITSTNEEKEKAKQAGREPLKDIVQINRTMAMSGVYAVIFNCEERWPAGIHNDPEVIANMTAPVLVTVEDEKGQERNDWQHTSPDHFYHATVYDRVAFMSLPRATGGWHPGEATSGWNP